MLTEHITHTAAVLALPNEAYALLDRVAPGSTYGTGGCWIFADALRQLRGGAVYVVIDDVGTSQHFVLGQGGRFTDVDGTWSAAKLRANMQRYGVREPKIVPWEGTSAGEIPIDPSASSELADLLRAHRVAAPPKKPLLHERVRKMIPEGVSRLVPESVKEKLRPPAWREPIWRTPEEAFEQGELAWIPGDPAVMRSTFAAPSDSKGRPLAAPRLLVEGTEGTILAVGPDFVVFSDGGPGVQVPKELLRNLKEPGTRRWASGLSLRRTGHQRYEGALHGHRVWLGAIENVQHGSYPAGRRQKRERAWHVKVDGELVGTAHTFREARAVAVAACTRGRLAQVSAADLVHMPGSGAGLARFTDLEEGTRFLVVQGTKQRVYEKTGRDTAVDLSGRPITLPPQLLVLRLGHVTAQRLDVAEPEPISSTPSPPTPRLPRSRFPRPSTVVPSRGRRTLSDPSLWSPREQKFVSIRDVIETGVPEQLAVAPTGYSAVPQTESLRSQLPAETEFGASAPPPRKIQPKLRPVETPAKALKSQQGLKNIRAILSLATPDEIDYWGKWYPRAHMEAVRLAERYNVRLDVVAGVIAALSPTKDWKENLRAADRALAGDWDHVAQTEDNRRKAYMIATHGDFSFLHGPKVIAFFKSIYDPDQFQSDVVLDTHAINIWRGIGSGEAPALTKPERAKMIADYQRAGQEFGLTPQAMQAITWVLWRNRKPSFARWTQASPVRGRLARLVAIDLDDDLTLPGVERVGLRTLGIADVLRQEQHTVPAPEPKREKTTVRVAPDGGYRNIMKVLRLATPSEREYWGKWYPFAASVVAEMAQKYDLPHETVAGVVAVTSPGSRWHQNIAVAKQIIEWWRARRQYGPWATPELSGVEGPRVGPALQTLTPAMLPPSSPDEDEEDEGSFERAAQLGRPYEFSFEERMPGERAAPIKPRGPKKPPLGFMGPRPAGYPANTEKALAILNGAAPEAVITGPKVTVFYQSLVDPSFVTQPVLDGHAINLWRGERRPLKGIPQPTGDERVRMEADYVRAAKNSGLTPQAVQAITWYLWKNIDVRTADCVAVRVAEYGGPGPYELPDDHQAGIEVPKGGSSCANCQFIAADNRCTNIRWIVWNGGDDKIPLPADRWCSDWWEPQAATDTEKWQQVGRRAYLREGKEPGEKAVVVLRIPDSIAGVWPTDVGEDVGPPHLTLAYIPGPHDDAARTRLLDIVHRVAAQHAPIDVTLSPGVDWFTTDDTTKENREIAHKGVELDTHTRLEALHRDLVAALGASGFEPSVRDEFKSHATLGYMPDRTYDGPIPEGSWTADAVVVWGWPEDYTFPFALEARAQRSLRRTGLVELNVHALEAGNSTVFGFRTLARGKSLREKHQRFVRQNWYMREGSNVAYTAAYGTDGQEVWLAPWAYVLDLTEESLQKSAALDPEVAALVEAVREQREQILTLKEMLEKMFANSGGYDAVRTEDRLVVLNLKALEKAPKRRRWTER